MNRILVRTLWSWRGNSIYNFYGDLERGRWSYKGMFNKKPLELDLIPNFKWSTSYIMTKSNKAISWPSFWVNDVGFVKLTYLEEPIPEIVSIQ